MSRLSEFDLVIVGWSWLDLALEEVQFDLGHRGEVHFSFIQLDPV